ncbi:hypothetical protein D3C80_805430 [compost metagenome]
MAQSPQQHVGHHVEPWHQAEVLEDHAAAGTPLPHLTRGKLGDILSYAVILKVQHLATARRNGAVQGMQQGGFAGAGTPDHRHEFTDVQIEVDVIQHAMLRFIRFSQTFNR